MRILSKVRETEKNDDVIVPQQQKQRKLEKNFNEKCEMINVIVDVLTYLNAK